jgi:hypothetical protein
MNTLTRNAGSLDRAIRILLGVGLLAIVFVGPRSWIGLIGLVPLLTGVFGFCPLYRIVGVQTCSNHG